MVDMKPGTVILREAKDLTGQGHKGCRSLTKRSCHRERMSRRPERSEGEGSLCLSRQTLRCAQGDNRRDMPLARRADLDRENSLSALEWRGGTNIIFFSSPSPPPA